MSTDKRIAGLDGVRALSISMVLVSHGAALPGLTIPSFVSGLGSLGVRIFFVVSGYLITALLLREHAKYGRISIKEFYLRRTFRIFPAFYAFIACMGAAHALGWIHLDTADILHAVTYTVNYRPERAWELGHIWSLSVEEQFYLLWPALLVALGMSRGASLAAGCLILAPLLRVLVWKLGLSKYGAIDEMFPTAMDSIGAGCFFAFMRPRLERDARYTKFLKSPLFLAVPAVILVTYGLRKSVSISYPIGETVLNLAIAVLIDWAMRQEGNMAAKMLNARPVAFVGLLSYSLYLWQQPFLNRHSQAWVCAFPQNLLFVFSAALLSYYLVERPFLRWRERITERLRARTRR